MIPAIGLMIAAYVFTRMMEMILRNTGVDTSVLNVIFAMSTMVVTAYCVFVLFQSGANAAALTNGLPLPF